MSHLFAAEKSPPARPADEWHCCLATELVHGRLDNKGPSTLLGLVFLPVVAAADTACSLADVTQ